MSQEKFHLHPPHCLSPSILFLFQALAGEIVGRRIGGLSAPPPAACQDWKKNWKEEEEEEEEARLVLTRRNSQRLNFAATKKKSDACLVGAEVKKKSSRYATFPINTKKKIIAKTPTRDSLSHPHPLNSKDPPRLPRLNS